MGNVLTFSILPITMQKGIFRDVKDALLPFKHPL